MYLYYTYINIHIGDITLLRLLFLLLITLEILSKIMSELINYTPSRSIQKLIKNSEIANFSYYNSNICPPLKND